MQNMSESPDNTNRVTRRTIVLTSWLPCKTKLQDNNNIVTKELQLNFKLNKNMSESPDYADM